MRAAGQNTSITDVAMAMPSIRLLSSVSMTRRLVFGLVGSLPEYSAFFALLAVLMWVYAVTGVFWFAGLMEEAGFSTLINALGAMFQVCVWLCVWLWLCVCGCGCGCGCVAVCPCLSWCCCLVEVVLLLLFCSPFARCCCWGDMMPQMMTGDWHDFMFGSVDAIGSLSTSIYYMSYVALVVRLPALPSCCVCCSCLTVWPPPPTRLSCLQLLLFANVFIGYAPCMPTPRVPLSSARPDRYE